MGKVYRMQVFLAKCGELRRADADMRQGLIGGKHSVTLIRTPSLLVGGGKAEPFRCKPLGETPRDRSTLNSLRSVRQARSPALSQFRSWS